MTMVNVVTQQPMAQPQNQLLVTGIHGHRTWSTGLFECHSDVKSCLLGLFCHPCTVCGIASRLGDCCCMPYCVPGGTVIMRTKIRTMGGITGSTCNDCISLSFCGICAVCQMERELNNMGIK